MCLSMLVVEDSNNAFGCTVNPYMQYVSEISLHFIHLFFQRELNLSLIKTYANHLLKTGVKNVFGKDTTRHCYSCCRLFDHKSGRSMFQENIQLIHQP